jgi:hypothetical protein
MRSSIRLGAALSILLLGACATPSTSPVKEAPPESEASAPAGDLAPGLIALRATQRWQHLIERKAELAWEYLSPGYRATHPREAYAQAMNQRPVQWYQVEAFEPGPEDPPALECAQPRACTIMLKVHFKVRSHLPGVGTLDSWNVLKEHWVNVRDQWYLVPEDVVR